MKRVVKSGKGWRVGYNPGAVEFTALLGTDDWAVEMTTIEYDDFCRLLEELLAAMNAIASELMDEEKVTLEVESDIVWLEISGYPQEYSLRFILNSGRGVEGYFPASVTRELLSAITTLQVF